MLHDYAGIIGVWENEAVVWQLCPTYADIYACIDIAHRVTRETGELGFYQSEFFSSRSYIPVTVIHWAKMLPLDRALLSRSLDDYLDLLESNGIAINSDSRIN